MAERVIEAAQPLDYAPRDSQRGLSVTTVIGLGLLLVLISAVPFLAVMALGARGMSRYDFSIIILGAAGLGVLGTGLYLIIIGVRRGLWG